MASHMTIGHFLITLNLSDYATRAASVYNYTRREYLPIRRALMSHFPNCVGNDKRDCQDPLIKCFDRRLRKAKTMARKITDMSRTASWEEPIENPLDDSEMVKSIRGDIIREERAILMIIAALVAVAAVGTGVGLGAYATYQVNQQAEELRNLQQQINIMKAKDERIERTVVIHNRTLQQFEKRFNDTFKITYQLGNETQSIRDVRYLAYSSLRRIRRHTAQHPRRTPRHQEQFGEKKMLRIYSQLYGGQMGFRQLFAVGAPTGLDAYHRRGRRDPAASRIIHSTEPLDLSGHRDTGYRQFHLTRNTTLVALPFA